MITKQQLADIANMAALKMQRSIEQQSESLQNFSTYVNDFIKIIEDKEKKEKAEKEAQEAMQKEQQKESNTEEKKGK